MGSSPAHLYTTSNGVLLFCSSCTLPYPRPAANFLASIVRRLSGLGVRKFVPATQERAFRMDYGRRFSGQRRLAIGIVTALWIVFSIHDFGRLNQPGPAHLHHKNSFSSESPGRSAGSARADGDPRALDESSAVGLLSVWTISCWFAVLRMVQVYPGDLAWREAYPILTFSLFMIFMAFRLRAATVPWLIGFCIVSYLVMLYFKHSGQSFDVRVAMVIGHAAVVPMMYIVGVLVSIPLERAARREFVYRRNLPAAKARIESTSRAINEQDKRMQELIREKERFFSSAYHDIKQPFAAINLFIRSARTGISHGHAVERDLDVIEATASDILGMSKDIRTTASWARMFRASRRLTRMSC